MTSLLVLFINIKIFCFVLVVVMKLSTTLFIVVNKLFRYKLWKLFKNNSKKGDYNKKRLYFFSFI